MHHWYTIEDPEKAVHYAGQVGVWMKLLRGFLLPYSKKSWPAKVICLLHNHHTLSRGRVKTPRAMSATRARSAGIHSFYFLFFYFSIYCAAAQAAVHTHLDPLSSSF